MASSVAGMVNVIVDEVIAMPEELAVLKFVWVGPMFQLTQEVAPGAHGAAFGSAAVGKKLLPLRVRVNDGLCAATCDGVMELSVGTGLGAGFTINAREFERPLVPAPECGLSVFTNAVPALATRAAGTVAVIPVTFPLLSVVTTVAIVWLFHCTTVLATNPAPTTVRVNCGLPAVTFAGDSELMVPPVGTWNVFP